ncbi:MAG: patatin-like phospholipase family protein, partial [Angelakisella sp.]
MSAIQKKPCRGVVLGGGGSKGSYEVGVWQAMVELGLDWQVVTGTSVGALNGALMALDALDEALEMWSNLDNTRVMSEIPAATGDSLRGVYRAFLSQMVKNGGVDVTPLEETIRRLADEDKLRSSPIEFGIVTVELATLRPVEWFLPQIPQGQVADFLLASAACFPAFRPRDIGGTAFVDGGYANNIPIDLALRAQHRPTEILAIDVEGIGVVRPVPSEVPVTTLRCYWDLGNILIFDSARCRRNIRLGYLDGMKVLGSYGGCAYTFAAGEVAALEALRLNSLSRVFLLVLQEVSPNQKRSLGALLAGRILAAAAKRRITTGYELDLRELLQASGELAAELLKLEPTELYTAAGFEQDLTQRFLLLCQQTGEALAGVKKLRELNL